MHFTRPKTSPFLTFPTDTAATRLETRNTKTTRKQSIPPQERKQKPFATHSVKYNRILAVSRAYCARLNVVMYDNKNTYESLSQNFNTFHSTLSTPQFTLHTSHSTLHTPHSTLHT